jgi:serine/threonine protein kinase
VTPERLKQIEDIFHAARVKDAGARPAFLAASCAGDPALRQEVESLLDQPTVFGDTTNMRATGAASPVEDLTGRRLGQYQVVAPLGSGGMAKVYKGYQESVDRFVAIKVLPRQCMTDPTFLERFKQEARIVARLQHPHILTVFDHGETDGSTFLAMPLIESGTLADVLSRGRLSFRDTERIITQVCEALDHAHAEGIVHRDIKPSNILIDSNGNAFVADFGIAKMLGSGGQLTQTGLFMGSPNYMSPEQMLGGDVGPHSDQYAVGLMLYEMLAGAVPFKADSALESISKHLNEPLPSPSSQNPEITPELEAVVLKALARSKDDRFATGKQLAAALSAAIRAIEHRQTVLMPSGTIARLPRASKTVSWVAAGLAVAALAILAVWLLRPAALRSESAAATPQVSAPVASPAPPDPAAQPANQGAASVAAAPLSRAETPATSGRGRESGSSPSASMSPARDNAVRSPADTLTAKQMYASSTPGDTVNPGLKYRIIQSRGSNGDVDADPAETFHSGDRVRFAFASNVDGYLYVVQRGSSGQWTVLFPDPEANGGRNAIRKGEDYFVPNNGWFAFDETPGTEEVFVVLSTQPLDALPGFETPVTRRESVTASVVDGLQRSIQSRDLMFEKERPAVVDGRTRQATYVVNRAELANRVAAFIPLQHAR